MGSSSSRLKSHEKKRVCFLNFRQQGHKKKFGMYQACMDVHVTTHYSEKLRNSRISRIATSKYEDCIIFQLAGCNGMDEQRINNSPILASQRDKLFYSVHEELLSIVAEAVIIGGSEPTRPDRLKPANDNRYPSNVRPTMSTRILTSRPDVNSKGGILRSVHRFKEITLVVATSSRCYSSDDENQEIVNLLVRGQTVSVRTQLLCTAWLSEKCTHQLTLDVIVQRYFIERFGRRLPNQNNWKMMYGQSSLADGLGHPASLVLTSYASSAEDFIEDIVSRRFQNLLLQPGQCLKLIQLTWLHEQLQKTLEVFFSHRSTQRPVQNIAARLLNREDGTLQAVRILPHLGWETSQGRHTDRATCTGGQASNRAAHIKLLPSDDVCMQLKDGLQLSEDYRRYAATRDITSGNVFPNEAPGAITAMVADSEHVRHRDHCLLAPERIDGVWSAFGHRPLSYKAQDVEKLPPNKGSVWVLRSTRLTRDLRVSIDLRRAPVYFASSMLSSLPVSSNRVNYHLLSLQTSGPKTYVSELHRVASFEDWPHLGKLSALQFTSGGFYSTGKADEVACFSCGLTLNKWSAGVHPLAVHREKCSGQCRWISDPRASGNVPLSQTTIPCCSVMDAKQPEVTVSGGSSAASLFASTGSYRKFDSISSGAGALTSPYVLCCSVLPSASSCLVKDPAKRHHLPCSTATTQSNDGHQGQQEELMKFESCRLNSYKDVWNYAHIVTPSELASNGFYYTGSGDRVQCAFCQGVLRNWEQGDRADEQHAKHFTYCRFVQGHDVGNVPIPFSSLMPTTKDVSIPLDTADSPNSEIGLGISLSVPKHADFAVEARRLATFATWPTTHHLNGNELARAGFFYTGTQDAVKCFYCDNIIAEWPLNSDPWVEHARFQSCQFLVHVKGGDFFRQNNAGGLQVQSRQKASLAVDPRELRARVDSPKVRILLQMDYPIDLIREVIQKRLATLGTDHETSEELLADVFAFHDEKQRAATTKAAGRQTTISEPTVVRQPNVHQTQTSYTTATVPVAVAASAPIALAASAPVAGNHSLQDQQDASTSRRAVTPTVIKKQSCDEENRQLKTQLTCKICMDAVVGIVFLPCGHMVCCPQCAPALISCPICRVSIRGTVRTML